MNWTFPFVVRPKQIFSGGGRPHLRPHAFSTAAVLREAHSQLTADKQKKQPQTSAHTGELAVLQKQWRSCSEQELRACGSSQGTLEGDQDVEWEQQVPEKPAVWFTELKRPDVDTPSALCRRTIVGAKDYREKLGVSVPPSPTKVSYGLRKPLTGNGFLLSSSRKK